MLHPRVSLFVRVRRTREAQGGVAIGGHVLARGAPIVDVLYRQLRRIATPTARTRTSPVRPSWPPHPG